MDSEPMDSEPMDSEPMDSEPMDDLMDIDWVVYGFEDHGERICSSAVLPTWGRRFLPPVVNQDGSSTCVPCSVASMISVLIARQLDSDVETEAPNCSKQEIVDCLPVSKEGVLFDPVLTYTRDNGVHEDKVYPFTASHIGGCLCSILCAMGLPKAAITEFVILDNVGQVIEALLAKYTVIGGMWLYESFLLHRPEFRDVLAVYSKDKGEQPIMELGRRLAHAFHVTSFGNHTNKDYFCIQNTYGLGWGGNGFARVAPDMIEWFACATGIKMIQKP